MARMTSTILVAIAATWSDDIIDVITVGDAEPACGYLPLRPSDETADARS